MMYLQYANEKPEDERSGVTPASEMSAAELRKKRDELREQFGSIGDDNA